MSLYNMLCGVNPATPIILSLLKLTEADFARFRDICIAADGKTITVYTRLGGGNRQHYQQVLDRLKAHPLYVRDYDDDFDNTFANVEFKAPGDEQAAVLAKLAALPQVGSEHPSAKMKRILEQMKEHKPGDVMSPEVANALRVGEALISQVAGLPPGHRGEVSNEHGGVVLVSGGTGHVNIKSKDTK